MKITSVNVIECKPNVMGKVICVRINTDHKDIYGYGEVGLSYGKAHYAGVGIAREALPRIFERGFTGCNGRLDKRATGIGLYLCREICRRLGHTITVDAEPGRGTRVIIGLERPFLEVE